MELSIERIFTDTLDNIYVRDINGVLYLYRDFHYVPFLKLMHKIQKCFAIGSYLFVHHHEQLSIFESSMLSQVSDDRLTNRDEDNVGVSNWLINPIKSVHYSRENNIIVTVENNGIYFCFNVVPLRENHRRPYRISFPDLISMLENPERRNKYPDDIKIIENLLLTWSNGVVEIFKLSRNEVIFLESRRVSYNRFKALRYNHDISLLRTSTNNSLETYNHVIFTQYTYYGDIHKNIQTPTYSLPGNRWLLDRGLFIVKEQNYLYCFFSDKARETVLKLSQEFPENYQKIEDLAKIQNTNIVRIEFPRNIQVVVLNGYLYQLIVIGEKRLTYDDNLNAFVNLVLYEEQIDFDPYLISNQDKSGELFVIDIYNDVPIIEQLIAIVPQIYRLNRELGFHFNYIDQDHKVISYGDGVTRQVFTHLRNELDELFRTNFQKIRNLRIYGKNINYQTLGKLLYFCCNEGGERFFHIDPYFMFLFSSEDSHNLYLINYYKGHMAKKFVQQYLEYSAEIESLRKLDIGLDTIEEFTEYILSPNLDDSMKEIYHEIHKGFIFFASREEHYNLSLIFPMQFHFDRLIENGLFNANIEYVSFDRSANDIQLSKAIEAFSQAFDRLSAREKALFLKNVTGSEYYTDTVTIGFKKLQNPFSLPETSCFQRVVHDSDTIIADSEANEQDLTVEQINDSENTAERIDTMDSDSESEMDDMDDIDNMANNLMYNISTCYAKLSINIFPTFESMKKLLTILIIDESQMVN